MDTFKIKDKFQYTDFKYALTLILFFFIAGSSITLTPFIKNGKAIIMIFCITITLFLLVITYRKPQINIFTNMFNHRYSLALILFILAVVFELHGSSLSLWAQNLGSTVPDKSLIMGSPRMIRSDEWAVNTPMLFSQYNDASGPFSYFSGVLRGWETDAFIIYGQPVLDIAVLFRPFHWGYLFLSPGKGLAFFWMGRLVSLGLVSIEFGMLLTKRKKLISVLYASFLVFAPVVQWWFAINGLVEMLVCGQLAILLVHRYLKTSCLKIRCCFAVVLSVCAGSYALTLYPSWQIPLFYVFLAVLVWVIAEYYQRGCLSKKDFAPLLLFFILFGGILFHILSHSYDTVQTIINTAYPGSRVEAGGGQAKNLFLYAGNLFFPFIGNRIIGNMCENAVFLDLFPLGLILSGYVILKQKNRDKLLIALMAAGIFLYLWCCIPWPAWLAKITLLSNAQPARAFLGVGLINILLLFRSSAFIEQPFKLASSAILSGLLSLIMITNAKKLYVTYFNHKMLLAAFIIITLFFLCFLMIRSKRLSVLLISFCLAMNLFVGATVNPLVKGTDAVLEQPLVKEIHKIANTDHSKWIIEGDSWIMGNLSIIAGAPTINSTNVYPNLPLWETIDPDKAYQDIYNRYAHIPIDLQDQNETAFVLETPDVFRLMLNIHDMKKLDIRYILTKNKLETYNTDKITFNLINTVQNYNIYQVSD